MVTGPIRPATQLGQTILVVEQAQRSPAFSILLQYSEILSNVKHEPQQEEGPVMAKGITIVTLLEYGYTYH